MTLAIYTPARGRHHIMRKSLARRLWTWLTGETEATIPVKHQGVTDELPVIDAEEVTDPLDPDFALFQPKLEPALLYEETIASAEHPTDPAWRPSWLDFTGYWSTIPVDDEQKALPVGSTSS